MQTTIQIKHLKEKLLIGRTIEWVENINEYHNFQSTTETFTNEVIEQNKDYIKLDSGKCLYSVNQILNIS